MKFGIIDEPVSPGAQDFLDISLHSNSLIEFIENSNTPITIGIQGEWGSGKTSLLNSMYHHFEGKGAFKQIWINSWESSLLSTPEEALLKIINEIIEELLSTDETKKRSNIIKNSAATVFKGALRIGATAALGAKAGEVAEELLGEKQNSIKALRNELKNLVSDVTSRKTNPYENVLIYVDDLDRIEPKNAVAVLELLKNIFSVPKCIFILAIDYQVVVKGLEHKFGKQTPENEWEFRAFFDKIIQLPFMMPMGQYNIGKYVNQLLINIGFVEGDGLDASAVREIIFRTIGGNPRSLKRLVNSVSLIEIFKKKKLDTNVEKKESDLSINDEKLLLFSLLCLQIAYPIVYSVLIEEPNFTIWDDEFAFHKTKRKEENEIDYPAFTKEYQNACQTEDFDEKWEQALFKIGYVYPRIKNRITDISKFLSYLKDDLLKDKQDNIGEILSTILSQTTVTSVSSTDQQQTNSGFKDAPWKSADEKLLANTLWNLILDAIENKTEIYCRGRRTGSSGVMRLTDKEVGPNVVFGLGHPANCYIYISYPAAEMNKGIDLMQEVMKNSDQIEKILGIKLNWKPSNKRAQYIILDCNDINDPDIPKFSSLQQGEYDSLDEKDFPLIVKIFEKYAPNFEKIMKQNIISAQKKLEQN